MTQEFHVSVTPVGDNEYLVRTEKVAPGVPLAEEQVKWPVEGWLRHTRQLMNDPLFEVLEGRSLPQYRSMGMNASSMPNSNLFSDTSLLSLVKLGQQLYQGLFQGTLQKSWICAQAIAQNRGELLQLRLGVKGKQLSSLPWEVLHNGNRPLATGTDVGFSRFQPGMSSRLDAQILTFNQPFKILVAIAAPSDQDSLQVEQEVRHLQQELQRETQRSSETGLCRPEIQLTILKQPDREQLTQALEQGKYQVFHYAGHSNLGRSGGELYLVNRRTGLTEPLNGEDLAGLLVNNGVQMAVLNSCRGAYGHTSYVEDDAAQVNLAEALVKRGIPGVLAMAERIPDEVALTLTRLLYRNLNQGHPIDLSLSRARQGLISAYGSDQLYWALPILYLHREFDGYLTASQPGSGTGQEFWQAMFDCATPNAYRSKDCNQTLEDYCDQEWESEPDLEVEEFLADFEDEGLEDLEEKDFIDEADDLEFIGDELRKLKHYSSPPQRSQEVDPPPVTSVSPVTPAPPVTPEAPKLTLEGMKASLWRSPPSQLISAVQRRLESVKPKPLKFWLPVTMLILILGGGTLLFQSGMIRLRNTQPSVSSSNFAPAEPQAPDLQTAKTDYVLGIAVEQFYQQNIPAGVEATKELLDRGALMEAKSALAAVSVQDSDHPDINFLWGRFMWQSIQEGSADYLIDDVRRYWARAAQQRPDSLEYCNALGFAYYAEGNLEQAYQTWVQVLELKEPAFRSQSSQTTQQTAILDSADSQHQILTAYAGLGLVLMKSSEDLPPDDKATRLSKAMKFRDKVLSEAPKQFKPYFLARNWLWTRDLNRDWQLLIRQ